MGLHDGIIHTNHNDYGKTYFSISSNKERTLPMNVEGCYGN